MKKKTDRRWIAFIVVISVVISIVFTIASEQALNGTGYVVAFAVLMLFILIGIIFDVVGVSVATATEVPFHSMASHKEKGASEALRLLRHAEKVSSVCNDVVGDISGIVSGTTAAVIVTNLTRDFTVNNMLLQLGVTGLVAGVTIGGKAIGKTTAMNNSTRIVLGVGKVICFITHIFRRK